VPQCSLSFPPKLSRKSAAIVQKFNAGCASVIDAKKDTRQRALSFPPPPGRSSFARRSLGDRHLLDASLAERCFFWVNARRRWRELELRESRHPARQ
jgi:hypothetical protein